MKRRTGSVRLWAAAFWLLVWEGASLALAATTGGRMLLLASPVQALGRLLALAGTAAFWQAVAFSSLRILGGFLLACALAAVLAPLAARFQWIRDLLSPLVAVVKAVPVVSFIILALIFFSSENLSLLISALMVFPPVYLNVLEGIGHTDRQLLEMARVFRIPTLRSIRYVYLPQVLPYFQSACGSALGLCWKSGIAAEVIGMPDGSIGEQLQQAKIYLNTPDLFAWTLVIVLVSLVYSAVPSPVPGYLPCRRPSLLLCAVIRSAGVHRQAARQRGSTRPPSSACSTTQKSCMDR